MKAPLFEGIRHFHLEGYQLMHHKLVRDAIAFAQAQEATISLDLSSFEVVSAKKEFIWELLNEGYIDIIFANQEEAFSLTGLSPEEASSLLANYCDISVVTMAERGSYVNHGRSQWQCPAFAVDLVDSIGAGDLFISGFLHGYLTGRAVQTCACIGTLLASHVVQVLGAEIPSGHWEEIYNEIPYFE